MKIGIKKESKIPPDERVPLSPLQCKEIIENYPHIKLVVQKSPIRRYKNEEYEALDIKTVDSIDDCDIILAVKEVKIEYLIPNKIYFYFSHTTKQQPYNRNLLKAMLAKNITMIDYENLKDEKNRRLIGFGRYAGIVGCYNTFYAYGKRTKTFELKRAYKCVDRSEMENELGKVKLPPNFKIVLTGNGRVANGAIEILNKLNIDKVSPSDFLRLDDKLEQQQRPVFTQLMCEDYNRRIDNQPGSKADFYRDPSKYESNFMDYAEKADYAYYAYDYAYD